MSRNIRKQNQKISFNELENKLKTTHTLSTKMICEYLKTYRPWVSKYILPKLDKLYIPNGYGNNSISWISFLNKYRELDLKESSWYCTNDFKELLKNSLVSCTRQTIKISCTVLLEEKERKPFLDEYIPLNEKLEEKKLAGDWKDIEELYGKIEELNKKYFSENLFSELAICSNKKRTNTLPYSVSPNFDYKNLMAVHDLKGYGGVDETIYRDLFDNGAVRIVFNFTSEKGEHGEKVFYYYDKNDEQYRLKDGSPDWTIPYSFFLENKKI